MIGKLGDYTNGLTSLLTNNEAREKPTKGSTLDNKPRLSYSALKDL